MKKIAAIFLGMFMCANVVNAQIITMVNPDSGEKGEYLTVSISGQGTSFGQGTSTTYARFVQASETTIYPYSTSINSSTSLEASFYFSSNSETGYYNVKVYNSYDGNMALNEAFYLYPDPDLPHIETVMPNEAIRGVVLMVAISGENTSFTQGTGTTEVWFNQGTSTIYPINVNVSNNQLINAEFAFSNLLPTGYYNINANNSVDGTLSLNDAFYLNCLEFVPNIPDGFVKICENSDNTVYTTNEANNFSEYIWLLNPNYAGEIIGSENEIEINWADNFTGIAELKVRAYNECDSDDFSEALQIEVRDGAAKANFDVVKNGLESSFINTSEYADYFHWDFGDQYTSNTDNPVHNYASKGTYPVRLIALSSYCGADTITKNITVNLLNSPLIFNDKVKFLISPNPSNGIFNIKFVNTPESIVTIDILNANSMIVKTKTIESNSTTLDMSTFAPGLYFYRLIEENKIYNGKLIVK